MLLSDLVNKKIYAGISLKGKCVGVGVSLKTFTVKYLICSSVAQSNAQADFCVSVASIEEIDDDIYLTRLRPAFPKNCAKVFPDRPIYTDSGLFVGNVRDMELRDFTAVRLFTDRDQALPVSFVAAFSDAVILKKEQAYPIGQRVPAAVMQRIFAENEPIVTRSSLRKAIKRSNLIRLTLSLPPFNMKNAD